MHLMKGSSQRACAEILGCSKNTVERKFYWLVRYKDFDPSKIAGKVIQIDEMESIEHTKLKPLTIPLCVSARFEIVGITVGKIPAKGHLSEISLKKYGPRPNERELALKKLFEEIKAKLATEPKTIITDGSPLYGKYIKEFFPNAEHRVILSRAHKEKRREFIFLKQNKGIYDEMFALNQRCAKLRSDIKRLTRRSWCTTKRVENLYSHLKLYQGFNNQILKH